MKKLLLTLSLALAQAAAWAAAVASPTAIDIAFGDGSVRVRVADGSVQALGDGSVRFLTGDGSVRIERKGDVETWTVPDFVLSGASGELASFSGFSFSHDSDPFIAFSVSLVNFTNAAQNWWFQFGTAYVGGPYDTLGSQMQLQASDESENSVTEVTNIAHESAIDGTTWLSPAVGDCSPPAFGCFAAAGSTSVASNATGTFTSRLSFTASARDTVIAQGRTDLFDRGTDIPEPSVLPLALLALAGLAVRRQTRRARPSQ